MSHALLEGLPRKGQFIKYYDWVSIWNTHVLNYKGHQLSVHNFFVQLYIHPYIPVLFAQLRTSRSGVGAFLWDFTKALGLRTRVYLFFPTLA